MSLDLETGQQMVSLCNPQQWFLTFSGSWASQNITGLGTLSPEKMPLGAYKQEFRSGYQMFPHSEAHPCMKVKNPFQQRVGLQNCLCTASSSEPGQNGAGHNP